jgi:hypothetical protein
MGKLRVLNRTSTIPNSSLVQNWITRLDSGGGGGGERNQSSISHCEGARLDRTQDINQLKISEKYPLRHPLIPGIKSFLYTNNNISQKILKFLTIIND